MQILGLGLRFHISVKLPGDANAAVHGALWGTSPTKLQYCNPRRVRAHEERGERFISDVCLGKEGSGELAVECNTLTRCFLRNHQNLTQSFTKLVS